MEVNLRRGYTMMRKLYKLSEAQIRKCAVVQMPDDAWFKQHWAKRHHGNSFGWGIGKHDWIVSNMKVTADYVRGLWQGRVDKLNRLPFSEERAELPYNIGYERGFLGWHKDKDGLDRATYAAFVKEYGPN